MAASNKRSLKSLELKSSFSRLRVDSQSDNEQICMEEIEQGSISSEDNSEDVAVTKDMSIFQQQPWNCDQITAAVIKLPAGETALAVLSTLEGDALENVLRDVRTHIIAKSATNRRKYGAAHLRNCDTKETSGASQTEATTLDSPSSSIINWPETWLLAACWLGHGEVVRALLKGKINVSTRDGDGRTPLHLASCAGHSKIVEELLKHGANPNDWDSSQELTAIHCAAAINDVTSLKHLIDYGGNVNIGLPRHTPLHYAVLNNACNCVEVLLKAGAIPNNPQVYTETPLHVAASLGSVRSVELLLSHGADVRVQFGKTRSTPLHLAAEEGSAECTRLLLQAGAVCKATNSRGQTAMHLAALAQSAETLEVLVAFGADVNAEDDSGRTPLHTAVAKSVRGSELIRILLQAGSNINKPDKFGYTPLHIAALNESSHVVNLLLARGADVTARTKGGISALSFIVRRTPDVLPKFVARMDQAISVHDHELGDVDCELRLDFRPLVPGGRSETDLMLCLVEIGQKHILKHPLCESFLHLKWLRIRKFFLFSLIFHSVFVAIFTSYITVSYLYHFPAGTKILYWPVAVFTCFLAAKEVFQLVHDVFIYVKRWENWLQWGVILATAIILTKPVWQHHIAAIGTLLVWTELMMVVGRFPMFGLYVQMFTQVSINFFKFIGAYLCLIIGFALGFTVLHSNYKAFANPLIGLLKTIVMMSGELEFEDIFFDNDPPRYPGTTHLMLLAFVILVTIILTNLMVGLAVSDIQELRRCAGLDRLVRRAELVAHLESMLFSKLLDRAPSRLVEVFRKQALLLRPPHHCAIHIRPNDPREKRLPRDLIKAVYTLVSERKTKSRDRRHSSEVYSLPSRLYSIASASDVNKQQLVEFASELKKFSQNISTKLETLSSRVEVIAREIDIQTDFS